MQIAENEDLRNINLLTNRFPAITSIKHVNIGLANHVYKIEEQGNIKYVKIAENHPHQMLNEVFALNLAKTGNIPCPTVIKFGQLDKNESKSKDFIVVNEIKGISLRNSNENKKSLYNLGIVLKKLHTISGKNFGWIDSTGKGNVNTWMEYLFHHYKTSVMKVLNNEKLLSEKESIKIAKLLNKHISKSM